MVADLICIETEVQSCSYLRLLWCCKPGLTFHQLARSQSSGVSNMWWWGAWILLWLSMFHFTYSLLVHILFGLFMMVAAGGRGVDMRARLDWKSLNQKRCTRTDFPQSHSHKWNAEACLVVRWCCPMAECFRRELEVAGLARWWHLCRLQAWEMPVGLAYCCDVWLIGAVGQRRDMIDIELLQLYIVLYNYL